MDDPGSKKIIRERRRKYPETIRITSKASTSPMVCS
jgi:hypothetical protein